MKSIKYSRGFSLIEIIVSVGVLAVVGTVLSQVFFTTTRTATKTGRVNNIKDNGEFALEIMSRLIRNAKNIVPSSCTGSATSSLSLIHPENTQTDLNCLTDSGNTRIASVSGSSTEYLTDENISVDCSTLLFTCLSQPGSPPTVKITFTLDQVGPTPVDQFERARRSFQTSVTLRNL